VPEGGIIAFKSRLPTEERGRARQEENPPAPAAVLKPEQMDAKFVFAHLCDDPDGGRIMVEKIVVKLKRTSVLEDRNVVRMFMQSSN
jgi:hypothetical protein